jgi:hypothetical protein
MTGSNTGLTGITIGAITIDSKVETAIGSDSGWLAGAGSGVLSDSDWSCDESSLLDSESVSDWLESFAWLASSLVADLTGAE